MMRGEVPALVTDSTPYVGTSNDGRFPMEQMVFGVYKVEKIKRELMQFE